MKIWKIIFVVLFVGLSALVIIFMCGNSYDFYTQNLKTNIGDETLNISISRPNDYIGLDVIIVVHGDGALDASAKGTYYPVFQAMTSKGYAVVSWDKQGVGESTGDWLNQSMDDRAREVLDVVEFIKSQGEFKSSKIGLWGTSQAGWVIPKIADSADIEFTILCAPAIDWIEQARYHTEKKLIQKGADDSQIKNELSDFDSSLKYFLSNSTYQEYVEQTGDYSISEERYSFIKKNVLSNAKDELKNFYSPILLLLGGEDINVDTYNTMNVYKSNISNDLLTVKWIEDTNHSFIKHKYINNNWLLKATYILCPRKIVHREFLHAISEFLESFAA